MTLSNKQLTEMVKLACKKLDEVGACNTQPYECPHIGDDMTCQECWFEKLKGATNDEHIKKI